MQPEFESRLGADVKGIVRDTERLIGTEITVVVDPTRASRSPDEPGRMGCDIDAYGAQILVGDVAYFPDASVFHELQHIRRILVEGVPRLLVREDFEPWSPQFETAMAQLDNNLEHLVIVPVELRAYPDRRAYWRGRLERMLASLAANEMPEADRHRFAMLGLLLVDQMLPDEKLRSSVISVLRGLGIEERSERYCMDAVAALTSKEKLVRITFNYFQLPTAAGCFEYLNSRNGSARTVPLDPSEAPPS
jgi:hypothetical protein